MGRAPGGRDTSSLRGRGGGTSAPNTTSPHTEREEGSIDLTRGRHIGAEDYKPPDRARGPPGPIHRARGPPGPIHRARGPPGPIHRARGRHKGALY